MLVVIKSSQRDLKIFKLVGIWPALDNWIVTQIPNQAEHLYSTQTRHNCAVTCVLTHKRVVLELYTSYKLGG